MSDYRGRGARDPELLAWVRRRLDRVLPPAQAWIPDHGGVHGLLDVTDAEPASTVVGPRDRRTMPPRVVIGLLICLLLGAALGAAALWRARPVTVDVPGSRPVIAVTPLPPLSSSTPRAPSATVPVGRLYVHVAGLVRRPGMVSLPAGSRVNDALRAAGGAKATADVGSVNLARRVEDGEQIVVLGRGASSASAPAPTGGGAKTGGGATTGGGTATGPLDLNSATSEQLEELPGVGPVLAGRILAWRQQNGRFSTVEELREVSGIGERTFANLSPAVRV